MAIYLGNGWWSVKCNQDQHTFAGRCLRRNKTHKKCVCVQFKAEKLKQSTELDISERSFVCLKCPFFALYKWYRNISEHLLPHVTVRQKFNEEKKAHGSCYKRKGLFKPLLESGHFKTLYEPGWQPAKIIDCIDKCKESLNAHIFSYFNHWIE